MASPLGYVYSRADALKRQLYDMITNPRDYASMLGGRIVEGGQEREALMNQAFADPTNPLKITNEKALAALTDKIMQGEMGLAQLGMTKAVPPSAGYTVVADTMTRDFKTIEEANKYKDWLKATWPDSTPGQVIEKKPKSLIDTPSTINPVEAEFFSLANKGVIRQAKDRAGEIKALESGESKFAEVRANLDDPKTYDLINRMEKRGYKTKVASQGPDQLLYIYKNEKDVEPILNAQTFADYGKAYGYSKEDIAKFYLQRGLGAEQYFKDIKGLF